MIFFGVCQYIFFSTETKAKQKIIGTKIVTKNRMSLLFFSYCIDKFDYFCTVKGKKIYKGFSLLKWSQIRWVKCVF